MKTPVARKLPSGSWRCQVMVDGKRQSFTAATKKDAELSAARFMLGLSQHPESMRLKDAIERYISSRTDVLSPSTIAGYRVIQRNRFQDIQNKRVSDIDDHAWQQSVNRQARTVSPKTLHSSALFIQSVLYDAIGKRFSARLPQIPQKDLPWLEPDQIHTFLDALRGNKYELPILLALSGLRQSEVLSVRYKDVDLKKETIRISGSSVKDEHGNLVAKETNKNASSNRTIPILIPRIAELVKPMEGSEEYIYHKYSNVLRLHINKVCAENDLPEIGVHGLRRSFCSLMYSLGVSELEAMRLGGWSDFQTMRRIYTRLAAADSEKYDSRIKKFFAHDLHTDNS